MNIITRKLIVEDPTYNDLQYVVEEKNKNEPSTLYIQGPFLMSEKKNKNGRIYKLDEMVKDVERYTKEMISENRALGELNHPTSVEINPERACINITKIWQEGNMFNGKAKVLSTPCGQIVRSLIMDGVKLGVSSRSLGKLIEKDDTQEVQGMHLICVDVVHDPSVTTAFVNGIMESKEWILNNDGTICEAYDAFEKTLSKMPKKDNQKEALIKEAVLKFINSLGNKK